MQSLDEAARLYLAWQSIDADKGEDRLDLAAGQARQVTEKLRQSNETLSQRLQEALCWLLVPGLSDPKGKDIEWTAIRLSGPDSLATRAWKRLERDQAVYSDMGGVPLRIELDRVPLWQGDHVQIHGLTEYFAKYLYLPRLRDESVLVGAVQDGVGLLTWENDTFAYADGWDEDAKRYTGLRAGTSVLLGCDSSALLVKPGVARKQMDAEKPVPPPPGPGPTPPGPVPPGPTPPGSGPGPTPPPEPASPTRFFGTVRIDATRMSRDAGKLAEEVVQHLAKQLRSDVSVTIEVAASAPDGYSEDVVRTVTENCRTLKFDSAGFETE